MIDTHTHLYLEEFAPDHGAAVERAIAAGVDTMIFPNVDASTLQPMRQLHALYPGNTFMAIGHHPTEVNGDDIDTQLKYVVDELANHPDDYVAIGEIGIDLYWDKQYREQQMEVLRRQMSMAAERELPVIIHCRDGLDEVLEVIDSLDKVPAGVFHSFGGTADDVERIRRRGDFYFGINGIVTFKNSRLREVLPAIGAERILLETDSPYLAPVPNRGKRNESAFMIHTASYVASTLGITTGQLDEITTASARALFPRIG
ncbi:MAG: TatD family hydrolase [Barnesiella sp.]|nr:TatD family hydrolase [Barnesiella sp.]MBD5257852.1 TatD family hydrolase [Barnesiella sp.]